MPGSGRTSMPINEDHGRCRWASCSVGHIRGTWHPSGSNEQGQRSWLSCRPCSETSVYREARPLKECDISERVTNVAIVVLALSAALLSTNPEAKHLPGISVISIAVIVISIVESPLEVEGQDARSLFLSVFGRTGRIMSPNHRLKHRFPRVNGLSNTVAKNHGEHNTNKLARKQKVEFLTRCRSRSGNIFSRGFRN